MTKSKGLGSCLGVKVSELKVMCGLALDPSTLEERAVKAVGSDPIPAEKFLAVFKQRLQGNQLAIEFKALCRNEESHSTNAAIQNVVLNVKQETVPYDHCQVIIWDRPDTMGTDYYNASYIDGYTGPKEYIACQGPNKKCMVSFWHMIWQERVECVVMATGLFENAMQQCDKYWIDNTETHVRHGYIHIQLTYRIRQAQLNVRTFRIQKEGNCETRVLTHYEMVGFHEEAADPGLLLDVWRRVHSKCGPQSGPLLVHCRCGGGRTAVFVALDLCLQQLRSEDRVDVYSAVLHIRRFRQSMVRTLSQYTQIYHAVAMYIQCGLTVHPLSTLLQVFQLNSSRGAATRHQRIEKEFQTLHSVVPRLSIGDCASGHRVENRCKNRDIMMLPPERARPYLLTTASGDVDTDFINAVFVDGYHSENMYLVTQWPIKKTIGDLWRLVFDFKMTSMVFMHDPRKFSRSYPRFWPKEVNQAVTYGPVSVRYLNCDRGTSLVTRTFAIRKPKRHQHLVAHCLERVSEDIMVMNNQVGRELRQDERVVQMFQVVSSGRRGSDMGHLSRNTSLCSEKQPHSRSCSEDGVKDRHRSRRRHRKWVGVDSRSLLAVMNHVTDWQSRTNTPKQPVCIVSKDGCSHVGIYCAIAACWDQARQEGEVDVFNAVRRARRHRPQLVPTIEEYFYIYNFLTEFITLSGPPKESLLPETSINATNRSSIHHNSPAASPALDNHSPCINCTSPKGSHHRPSCNKNNNHCVLPACNKTQTNERDSSRHFSRYHDNISKQNETQSTSGNSLLCVVVCGKSFTADISDNPYLPCSSEIGDPQIVNNDATHNRTTVINEKLSGNGSPYSGTIHTSKEAFSPYNNEVGLSQRDVNIRMLLMRDSSPGCSLPCSGCTQSASPASFTRDHTSTGNDTICMSESSYTNHKLTGNDTMCMPESSNTNHTSIGNDTCTLESCTPNHRPTGNDTICTTGSSKTNHTFLGNNTIYTPESSRDTPSHTTTGNDTIICTTRSCSPNHTTVGKDTICSSNKTPDPIHCHTLNILFKGDSLTPWDSQNTFHRYSIYNTVMNRKRNSNVCFPQTMNKPQIYSSGMEREEVSSQPERLELNNNRPVHPPAYCGQHQSKLKIGTNNNGCDKPALVHASYASMEDEDDEGPGSGSGDERDHVSSFGSLDRDKEVKKKQPYIKLNCLVSPARRKV